MFNHVQTRSYSFHVEVLRATGGKTSTKYVAANPNVGISGGSSAQAGHTCTWSAPSLSDQSGLILTFSTLTAFSFVMFSILTSTRSQFRHLVLRAVPMLSSSPKA